MGLYLRKSFKAGPVRLNFSKSGIGVSAGVKGLRVGSGPKGNYIHAGRGGLYYRQSLGKRSSTSPDLFSGILYLLGIIFIFGIISSIFRWFIENQAVFFALIGILVVVGAIWFFSLVLRVNRYNRYKQSLDAVFLIKSREITDNETQNLIELRTKVIGREPSVQKIQDIEENIYRALLDKIIDDRQITTDEKKLISEIEKIIGISDEIKLGIKKEIFSAYYLDVISDRTITKDESKTLKEIIFGLNIPKNEIASEIAIIQEIIKAQGLYLPLPAIEQLPIQIQKSETPHYVGKGKILSRKKAKKSSDDQYEYSVAREGILVITNKRLLVVKEGTSILNFTDIVDIDVVLDRKLLIASKKTSSKPFLLETSEPFYCGRMIDLLTTNAN